MSQQFIRFLNGLSRPRYHKVYPKTPLLWVKQNYPYPSARSKPTFAHSCRGLAHSSSYDAAGAEILSTQIFFLAFDHPARNERRSDES